MRSSLIIFSLVQRRTAHCVVVGFGGLNYGRIVFEMLEGMRIDLAGCLGGSVSAALVGQEGFTYAWFDEE